MVLLLVLLIRPQGWRSRIAGCACDRRVGPGPTPPYAAHLLELGLLGSFVLLTVVLVVFPLVASTAVVNVGVYALIYGLAAIGLSLLMGLAGQVSLGHAAFFAVGAYTQALLVTKAGWSMWPAAVVATMAAMVVALLLVGLPLLRLRGHFLALATLGLGIIVTIVVREPRDHRRHVRLYGIPKPEFGGRLYNSAQEYRLLAPFVVIGMLLATNLVRSRMGRALGAVNDSEVAAECLASTPRAAPRVFVLAAGYAGLAGVFYAHWLGVVSPEAADLELSVELLLMVVLGGLGSVGCADRRRRRQRHGRGGEGPDHRAHPWCERRGAAARVRRRPRPRHHSRARRLRPALAPAHRGANCTPSTEAAARTAHSTESTPSSSVQHTRPRRAAPTGRAACWKARPPRAGIAAAGRAT